MKDPIERFVEWYDAAVEANVPMPDAMVLSTERAGAPSSRVVLYRGMSEGSPRFFTNYRSRKGRELEANARAALLFHWAPLERQVRIEGAVEMVSADESDEYFRSRPYGHQLNAWASSQSEEIASRDELLARVAELANRFPEGAVPRPPHWGGYRVVPAAIELWQGRADRMHERELFERVEGGWKRCLLSP